MGPVVALGEQERWWGELWVGDVYRWRGKWEARCLSRGEGDADMGRRWRAWWRSADPERWQRALGTRGGALRERERWE